MTQTILAIDPGPVRSAFLLMDEGGLADFATEDNVEVLRYLRYEPLPAGTRLAVEMVASYGMPVGADVFETCVWVGRFWQAWLMGYAGNGAQPIRVYRREVKLHLCGRANAKDPNIRTALIDRYGNGQGKAAAIGTKAAPGPLYGVAGDVWAALGVAVTVADGAVSV